MENNWLNLINLLEWVLISTEIVYHLKRIIFNKFLEKKSYEFQKRKENISPDNLTYKYKTERRIPKDFSNYQNLRGLFINLRDGNLNQREVSKTEINLKSDQGEIKKGSPKSKSEDGVSIVQGVQYFFDLREKIINSFRDYSIVLCGYKYKAKHGKGLKIVTVNKYFKDYQ